MSQDPGAVSGGSSPSLSVFEFRLHAVGVDQERRRESMKTQSEVPASPSVEKVYLTAVEARNWTGFGPCPCEKRNAKARDHAIDAMERHDTAEVMYQYLRTRAGQQQTRIEAIAAATFAGFSPWTVDGLRARTARASQRFGQCRQHVALPQNEARSEELHSRSPSCPQKG
jgi:hypothetical protein